MTLPISSQNILIIQLQKRKYSGLTICFLRQYHITTHYQILQMSENRHTNFAHLPAKQQQKWQQTQFEELEALKRRNVYELTELPPGRKAIKNRWTFDIKTDGRKKARLVAKGFSQIEGLDYDEIFSPVVRFETIQTILALAVLENWTIEAVDVKSAFLYGPLEEEIYMEQPMGFVIKGKEHLVLRLLRALYGLKQGARVWWIELDKSLKSFGFKRLYADAGIFVAQRHTCILTHIH